MTQNDNELLSSYLDGELSAREREEVEIRLAQDSELRAQFEKLQRLNHALKSTYDTPASRAIPPRVAALLRRSDPKVVAFPSRQRKARWGLALAASIMAASGISLLQSPAQIAGDTGHPDAALLAQALNTSASRAEGWETLSDGHQIRPLLTYARSGGGWCREYLLSQQQQQWRGVACQDQFKQWHTEVLAEQAPSSSSSEYRTASATDTNSIAVFMEQNADGIALSLEQEEALIKAGW